LLIEKRCKNLTDVGLSSFSASLKHLQAIKSLSLNFGDCGSITDIGLTNFGENLKSLQPIQNLKLNFGRIRCISEKGIYDLAQIFDFQTSLKNLYMSFDCFQGNADNAVTVLSEKFKNLNQLQSLYLNFSHTNISDNGLAKFSRNLKDLNDLMQNLTLTFDMCFEDGLTHDGVQNFRKDVKSLKNIKQVFVYFEGWE